MPIALVTGVNGFTGRHLVPELQQAGYTVIGVAQESLDSSGTNVIKCDLTNRRTTIETLSEVNPEAVFHLAGIAFAAHDDVEEIYRTNILGTRNLLEALSHCQITPRSVLLASSANIYGNATATPISEDTPPAPANDYAVSKLAMEYMARLWADRLPIIIARPFNYTGRGQSLQFLLPKIVDHFRRRASAIELGNLNVVRDFSDVRTVVRTYRRLVEAGIAGEVYNVCSGAGHSLQDIISTMRELSRHDLEVIVNPTFVRTNEIFKLVGSRAKLDRAIGPVESIPIPQTLQWMLASTESVESK